VIGIAVIGTAEKEVIEIGVIGTGEIEIVNPAVIAEKRIARKEIAIPVIARVKPTQNISNPKIPRKLGTPKNLKPPVKENAVDLPRPLNPNVPKEKMILWKINTPMTT
jgi:hypothetical protein